jgi:DNA polymerase-3 subunit alpha
VDILVSTAAEASRAKKMAVGSLFGDDSEMTTVKLDLVEMTEYDLKQILALEKETLGIYVSGHPLDEYKEQLSKLNYTLSSAIDELGDSSTIIIIGKVEEIQEKISKKGNKFGIINLMDYHGNIEFMLFADMLEELQGYNLEEPLAFKVKIQKDDQFTRISARKILTLKEVNKQKTKEVAYVPPPAPELPLNVFVDLSKSEELLMEFYRLAKAHPGQRKLHITLTSKLQNVVIDSNLSVNSEIITKIEALGLKIA